MALQNNPNSWNGGSAVFNPAPITETYLKLAAHREAKNQALEQYQRKKMESIDRDGVRDVDMPEFSKKIDEWNKHWQFSKDKIKKGDILSQVENDKRYNEVLAYARNSKLRAEREKQAIPVGVSMKNEMGTYPDQFQQELISNNLPLNAEGSKPIDLMPYMMKPDRWDLEKGLKKYSQLERDKRTVPGQTDPNTGLRPVRTEEFFNDKSKAQIAAIAGSDFHNDRSFNQEVRTAVTDPATKQQLAEVFEQNFGVKPEQPEHYATAFILAQKPLTKVEDKFEEDKQWAADQKFKRDKQLEGIRQAGRMAVAAFNANSRKKLQEARLAAKKVDKKDQENVLNDTFAGIEEEAKKNGKKIRKRGDEVIGEFYMAKVPDMIRGELGRKNKDGKLEYPNDIAFNTDGTVDIIYYKTDENDKVIESKIGSKPIDRTKTNTITKDQFKAILGKKLFGVTTTSGADYGDDDFEEDEEDEEIEFTPQTKTKADPLKLF